MFLYFYTYCLYCEKAIAPYSRHEDRFLFLVCFFRKSYICVHAAHIKFLKETKFRRPAVLKICAL